MEVEVAAATVVTSRHVMSCHVMRCHAMSCHAMPYPIFVLNLPSQLFED